MNWKKREYRLQRVQQFSLFEIEKSEDESDVKLTKKKKVERKKCGSKTNRKIGEKRILIKINEIKYVIKKIKNKNKTKWTKNDSK